ncbi:MxaD family protein [Alphaproteobacteria bacterium 46_93_T64]|nr:MxaD family protein [Alphaproteobacteria bacterium 46_93_T64]
MIKVCSTTIINVPLADIWTKVKDFNGLPNWHPAATDSRIEESRNPGEVGCVRNFALSDGSGRIRETLLRISDLQKTLTYNMLSGGPLPFVDYISTMSFEEITNQNQTFAKWTAEFSVSDGQESHWENFVANDVFLGGFKALEESFS